MRVIGASTSDVTEHKDSTSDPAPSWVRPIGVDGCSGLWILDALVHLLTEEGGEEVQCSSSLFSVWLQASARACWVLLSTCFAALLVSRPEGVACVVET